MAEYFGLKGLSTNTETILRSMKRSEKKLSVNNDYSLSEQNKSTLLIENEYDDKSEEDVPSKLLPLVFQGLPNNDEGIVKSRLIKEEEDIASQLVNLAQDLKTKDLSKDHERSLEPGVRSTVITSPVKNRPIWTKHEKFGVDDNNITLSID